MKKVLIVATISAFLNFERNDIKLLSQMGYEVHCATNFNYKGGNIDDIKMIRHQIDFERVPVCLATIKAYKQLLKLLKNEKFDLIHCHTPVGGVLARLASRKYRKKGLKVIYTAHGFHFFRGAPLKNWVLYYPIEWICSWVTDILITINKEDYKRAKKHFHAKKIVYIPGVGLNTEKFRNKIVDTEQMRRDMNIKKSDIVLFSIGELSERKNHQIIIEALHKLDRLDICYLIAGQGHLHDVYEKLIEEYKLQKHVKLLGRRGDIAELCKMVDIYVHPSIREGLGIAPLEAMASGLPLIASNINGMRDYIENGKTGVGIDNPTDVNAWVEGIKKLILDKNLCKLAAENNKKIALKFDISQTEQIMKQVYEDI